MEAYIDSYVMNSNQGWQYHANNEQCQSLLFNSYLHPRAIYKAPSVDMPVDFQETVKRDERFPHKVFVGTPSPDMPMEFQESGKQEHYSRKVFIGGLPPDIYEEEIFNAFSRFGQLTVSWPQKAETKPHSPPKGYAFLIFQREESVQLLIDVCRTEQKSMLCSNSLYFSLSSYGYKDKQVQIRPWRLADAEYIFDPQYKLDPRKTVFVGGVPRPLKAGELALIMNNQFGSVCCAAIDTDPDLKYPKGAARVTFCSQESYLAAIKKRFVNVQHLDMNKRVELKPFVLDGQICDACFGNKSAPFFCSSVSCLKYFCEFCWSQKHAEEGKAYHKPVVKEWADRPRTLPYRRC